MNRDSLLSLVQSEPERVKLLVEVAGGGAFVLSIWALIGDSFFGDFLYLPITMAMAVAYAAALIAVTGNLVRGADRWQVESARQARRLLRTAPNSQGAATPALAAAPASFDYWYFVLRLEDEIKRARRLGERTSVVIMRIDPPGGTTDSAIEQINYDVASMAASYAQTMSMPSAIASLEYAFVLPGVGREEAKSRIAPLLGPLGDYWCEFAIAVYPDDASQAESLVQLARDDIEDSIRSASA